MGADEVRAVDAAGRQPRLDALDRPGRVTTPRERPAGQRIRQAVPVREPLVERHGSEPVGKPARLGGLAAQVGQEGGMEERGGESERIVALLTAGEYIPADGAGQVGEAEVPERPAPPLGPVRLALEQSQRGFEVCDHLARCQTRLRAGRSGGKVGEGAHVVAAVLEVIGERARDRARLTGVAALERLAEPLVAIAPARLGNVVVDHLPVQGVPEGVAPGNTASARPDGMYR